LRFILSLWRRAPSTPAATPFYDSPSGRKTTMKITAVEAIHLRAEDPLIELFDGSYDDCVLVVHTDAGLTGIGETESMAPAIQAIVRGPSAHNHARALSNAVLIGADPSDPVALWQRDVRGDRLPRPPRPDHARHRGA
jgi:L-alanine-DL-glutamate epimerase-like enolase superfamily enzyme